MCHGVYVFSFELSMKFHTENDCLGLLIKFAKYTPNKPTLAICTPPLKLIFLVPLRAWALGRRTPAYA